MKTTPRTDSRRLLRGLYAITPELEDCGRLLDLVRSAIAGGARLVQYRAKFLDQRERGRQARALLRLCRESGVPLIINDDLELARRVGADGVHLGRDDVDPRLARERWPEGIIGVSCYADAARVAAAAAGGADYVGVGSIFPSSTKPHAVRAGVAALKAAKQAADIPVAAIGGITPANVALAVAAGADMVAVLSALFECPDVAASAARLSLPFATSPEPHVRTQPAAL